MGLFDNLFKKSKPSSTDRNSQVKGKPKISFEPFNSEAEKQYYEMAYGLLASSTKERSGDDIRRFVGFHTSRETDFSVSSAACKFLSIGIMREVSLFKSNADLTTALTAKGISSDKIEQIIELNKKLDESFAYRYLPEDADTICNPDNYDCDFYKKTLVFKNSRDSIVPLTAEKAAALKAAAERAAAEKAAAEKAAAEKAAAEKAAAEKAAAERTAAEKAAAEKAAAERTAAEKAAAEKAAAERAAKIAAKRAAAAERAAAEKAAAEKAAAEKAAAEKAAAERAAAEKAAAERAAAEKAAAEKAAAERAAKIAAKRTAAAERAAAEQEKAVASFKSEFEKMWANLEKDPYSIRDEMQKLKEIKDTTNAYGAPKANKLFETCFINEVKEKIYSRSSSASFIIGNVLKSNFERSMQQAYSNGKLHGHLIGFVLCANRYEKFTGNYADYPKLSDEEISNFIINETSFSNDRASDLTVKAKAAINSFVFWLNHGAFGYLLTNSDKDDNYDEFIFGFICSAIFSAYFNDSQYEKGNSESMLNCIYNNIPVITQYCFCKNFNQYSQVDLTHMMYNHDAAFSAMLNYYGFTRADRVADLPYGTKRLMYKFDGRNC